MHGKALSTSFRPLSPPAYVRFKFCLRIWSHGIKQTRISLFPFFRHHMHLTAYKMATKMECYILGEKLSRREKHNGEYKRTNKCGTWWRPSSCNVASNLSNTIKPSSHLFFHDDFVLCIVLTCVHLGI